MEGSHLLMTKKFLENLMYFISIVVFMIAIVAITCGDGDKGLIDLFKT